jgi:hypothetical protein
MVRHGSGGKFNCCALSKHLPDSSPSRVRQDVLVQAEDELRLQASTEERGIIHPATFNI